MLIMKYKILMICALSVLISGCSHNIQRHLTEILTVKKGGFDALRDAWIVEESLPSDAFSLTLEPYDPLTTPKGTFPLVLLKGDQIPVEERFIFAIIDPLSKKIDARFEFEMQENGKIKVYDRNGVKTENEIPFVAAEGLLMAKPIVYAVVSKDKSTIASTEFIPYPLDVKMEDGAHASVVVTHPMLTRFDLRANGFAPHEKIKAIHRSGETEETLDLAADENGAFLLPLNPTVIGRMGGEASLVLIRENGELCLDYPWGAHLEKKTFEERSVFPVLFVVNRDPEEIDSQLVQKSFLTTSLN